MDYLQYQNQIKQYHYHLMQVELQQYVIKKQILLQNNLTECDFIIRTKY